MQRRESIKILSAAICYLFFTNSCSKAPYLEESAESNKYGDIDSIFEEAMSRGLGNQQITYLTEKVKRGCYNTNAFLRERVKSDKYDEIYAFGRIRTISKSYLTKNVDSKNNKVFAYNNKYYEIILFENIEIIRLPMTNENSRRIPLKFSIAEKKYGEKTMNII